MCVAILCKPGARVTDAALWKGWGINRDGGGMAFINKHGKLVIDKGYTEYNAFHKALTKHLGNVAEDSPFMIHMRIRSAGDMGKNNHHPFAIKPQNGPSGALMHNGTLFQPSGAWRGEPDDLKSDTRVVANALNNILSAENVLNSVRELGIAIGTANKMVFLYEDKTWAIINEEQGVWDNDVWYSNGSCGIYKSYRR